MNDATQSESQSNAAAEPAHGATRKPLIRSITSRTMVNYVLFSVILLAVLWAVFFVGLYGIYSPMLTRDIRAVGSDAMASFPKRDDDNGMTVTYKSRLGVIARDNGIAAVVFTRVDGGYTVRVSVDGMSGGAESADRVFAEIMKKNNLKLFTSDDNVDVISTRYGDFVCYGNMRTVEGDFGPAECFLLIMKPYSVFDSQTKNILYTLVLCTIIVLVIACLFAYFASRFQTKRLKEFSEQAKRLAEGDHDVKFALNGYVEYDNLANALNAAKLKMEQSEQLQRDITANISHDIRTPLTMIRAYAEMLRDWPLKEEKRVNTANVIISEADRLAALTADVLDYSKLQAGTVEFKFEPCNISAIAESVLAQFEIFRERDGIKFIADIEKELTVKCDKLRIEQVLYNLIINAINYRGTDASVMVYVRSADGHARVEVGDHGQGIEQKDIDAVWERYYRAARHKRATVGSGLGLSICKNILTEHAARFGVESTVGVGTTFWFELDLIEGCGEQ